jgi:hypothetical protein
MDAIGLEETVGFDNAMEAGANLSPPTGIAKEGVTVAVFAGFDDEGRFQVSLPGGQEPVTALSTVGLGMNDVGSSVVIAFDSDNDSVRLGARRPIIIGRLKESSTSVKFTSKLEGERVVLKAEHDIELRCGDASIVLTRAGKVLIKGNFVLTRSRGANKIKGAYVDIN